MDETSQKIIDATMSLIRDKGYVATTTKDIANAANVNGYLRKSGERMSHRRFFRMSNGS